MKLVSAQTRRTKQLRAQVLDAYGGACVCCGTTIEAFLCLDHVGNTGFYDRKVHGVGIKFYQWLIQRGFPPEIQILCVNCNLAKSKLGFCPHGGV